MPQFSLALDSSQIVSFMECPQKWAYSYKMNLEPKERSHEAFSKGTIIHGLLERYYRFLDQGFDKAQGLAVESFKDERKDLGVSNETFVALVSRFLLYCQLHKDDLVPLVHNGKKCIELGFSLPLVDTPDFLFVLEGRIDLGAQFDNFVVVVDHKSQSRHSKFYSHAIQFLNYCLALNTSRMMVNVIGLQDKFKPDYIFRQLFYYSPEKLRQWKEKLILIFYRIADSIAHEEFIRNESQCPGKYNYPCDFCKICEETDPEIVSNIIRIKYKEREPWTPWSEEE